MIDKLRAALADRNVQAFLRVIRAGEGTADEDGYRRHFGGELFTDFSQHPKRSITKLLGGKPITSTAAGAYQFLSRTWSECQAALNLPDFSPASQDLAAVFLIARRKGLEHILAGRLEQAIAACAAEWASLPGSPYGQPVKTLAQCRAVYEQHGGVYGPAGGLESTAPLPTPQPDPKEAAMPIPVPFLMGLAQSLIGVFAPLAQEKISKEINRHSDNPQVGEQIAAGLIQSAQTLTGKEDPVAAVAAAREDPVIVEKLQADTLADLDKLLPVLDKLTSLEQGAWKAEEDSRRQADERARSAEIDQDPFLTQAIVWLLVGLLVALMVLIGVMQYIKADAGTVGTLIGLFAAAGGAVTAKFGSRYDHRYGSSRGSAAKDVITAELARRK
jgi:muramidase (phage lysozyme)